MTWNSRNLPQAVIQTAVHFTMHLKRENYVKNNTIEKDACRKYYMAYSICNKVSYKFFEVMLAMLQLHLIINKKNKDKSIIFFKTNASKMCLDTVIGKMEPKVSTGKPFTSSKAKYKQTAAAKTTNPSNEQKKTHPLPANIQQQKTNLHNQQQSANNVQTTGASTKAKSRNKHVKYVSQRVNLPSAKPDSRYISDKKCYLCNINFQNKNDYSAHLKDDAHNLRRTYRTNKKELASKNKNIVIESNKNEGLEKTEITADVKSNTKLVLHLKNNSDQNYEICEIIRLYTKLREIKLTYKLPINLKQKSTSVITIKFCLQYEGAYLLPLVFVAKKSNGNDKIYLLKELAISVQSEAVADLEIKIPYTRTTRAAVTFEEVPIIEGRRPPKSSTTMLAYVKPLKAAFLPYSMIRLLNAGLKLTPSMSQRDQGKLRQLKRLLAVPDRKNCLTPRNYCKMLETLLYFEEHQMKKNIRDYDCENQKLDTVPGTDLLKLEVPGLAENRPSLIKGDEILVRIPGDGVRYRGYVHRVQLTSVTLGFYERFVRDTHHSAQRYQVTFGFNRLTIKTEHQAVELVNTHEVQKFFFPQAPPKSSELNNMKFDWFVQQIKDNKEQQQAVRHIISRTSYPYPYLLFGPPGTGKTMTVCETILQLWKRKPECHILVAAPSNSAANEITTRLVNKIPKTDLFRMISSSFDYEKIPNDILPYCNILNGEYHYPELKVILKYRILIVTLTAAAKLVCANIPTDHFSYVFIDESGHATESEVLIPIAGIVTSQGRMNGQVVLAGDPKQLGPIIHSKLAESYGFGTSMLERLMTYFDVYKKDKNFKFNPNMVTKLLKNFRSHKAILQEPDRMFYDEELKYTNSDLVNIAVGWEHLPNKNFPIIFHSVKGKDEREENSPSYFNKQEVDVVIKYLRYLIGHRLKGRMIKQSDIGIVSPYRKQVQKLSLQCKKSNWNDVLIGSVEQFQGQERLIIIISTVRSTQKLLEHDYRFHLGFLKNPKRFNVAVTRAKALVIIVGNPDVLQCDQHWGEFIEYCHKNGATTGIPFELKAMWKNDDDHIHAEASKFTLQCDTQIENKKLHYEHSDFSRGNL